MPGHIWLKENNFTSTSIPAYSLLDKQEESYMQHLPEKINAVLIIKPIVILPWKPVYSYVWRSKLYKLSLCSGGIAQKRYCNHMMAQKMKRLEELSWRSGCNLHGFFSHPYRKCAFFFACHYFTHLHHSYYFNDPERVYTYKISANYKDRNKTFLFPKLGQKSQKWTFLNEHALWIFTLSVHLLIFMHFCQKLTCFSFSEWLIRTQRCFPVTAGCLQKQSIAKC